MRRIIAALVLALGATALTGCTGTLSPELPAGVSVSVQQNRDDYGPRRLEVLVANNSAEPLDVWEARLDSSAFAAPSVSGTATVRPGTTTALRVQLAPADCSDPAQSASSLRLAFTRGSTSGTVTVEPDDPLGTIARVHAEDCLDERVSAVATIAAGDRVDVAEEGGQKVAHLSVVIAPTGGAGSVTVDSIGRTILLRPASGDADWPVGAKMDSASAPITIDLAIIPNNCNTHTVSEDKRGTFLPVSVTLASGDSGIVFVGVDRAVRGALYDYIASDYCSW